MVTGSVQVPHPGDAKRAHYTIMFRYRHILARHKAMPIKFEPGLIVFAALRIVVECPCAASAMHEMAYLVFGAWPKSLDAAPLTRRTPLVSKKVSCIVQGAANSYPRALLPFGNSWSRASSSLMRRMVMTVVLPA
jgi:hypothetical protein